MPEIFPNVMKTINHRSKKAQQTVSKRNITTPTHVIKLFKINDRNMPYLI